MIKQLLIGASALALTAGAAHAQTIGVPPADDLTPYFVLTAPVAGANQSEVNQVGNGNTANVDQTGATNATADNKVRVDQGRAGGYANQNNRADIDQDGAGNRVRVKQVTTSTDNTPYVGVLGGVSNLGPYGSDGQLISGPATNFIVSDGALGGPGVANRVIVNQKQTTAGGGNQAVVLQGSEMSGAQAGATRSLARIDQTGGGNKAAIQQGATAGAPTPDNEDGNMVSIIAQTGRGNVAENSQGELDRSKIVQKGNFNQAYINEAPIAESVTTDVYGRQSTANQIGNLNTAIVNQTNSRNASVLWQGNDQTVYADQPLTTATANLAIVEQAGTDGYAETWQGVARSSSLNYADVSQTENSTFAQALTYQNGDLNKAEVTQDGANGYSFASQGRQTVNAAGTSRLNELSVEQLGDNQFSQVLQGYNRDSDFNSATVTQTAFANFAQSYVQQEGNSNDASVYQNGTNAYSELSQDGNNNFADVQQYSTGAYSQLTQKGNGNDAWITQEIGAGQKSVATQTGNNNYLDVWQQAANVTSGVVQTGNSNTAHVNQLVSNGAVSNVSQIGNGNNTLVTQ